MQRNRLQRRLLASAASALILATAVANAQGGTRHDYSIAAQSLDRALREIARRSGREILFSSDEVAGLRAAPLRGQYTVEDAVRRLLRGTGLKAQFDERGIVIKGRKEAPGQTDDGSAGSDAQASPPILVTGSRIAGSSTNSPVIVRTQREIRDAGFTNLGDLIRSVPQNFSGGQNPTVAGGGSQGANNENTTSSSTLNLRGIGADATLTLLNGHRLPYDGVFQGVDIASIPLGALDRIEIVTDGASAIYGSDAVAGVANIILKRSFAGLESSARYGGSTDGGNEQVQLSLVGGSEWASGGFMLAADYSRQTAINAGDRDYASTLNASQTLVPGIEQYSGLLTAYQDVSQSARVALDATYSHRVSSLRTPTSPLADYLASGLVSEPTVEAFTISPSMRVSLSPSWSLDLQGTYGISHAKIASQFYGGGAVILAGNADYENELRTFEVGAAGSVLSLPGGALKLALGGGYRANQLDLFTRSTSSGVITTSADFTRGRDSWFAYGELNAPLVGAATGLPFVDRLIFNAALRHEAYRDVGAVTTPKLGALYSPVRGLDLRLSWGRSFKAPTLYQQFQYKFVALRPTSAYGATAFPAGSTVLALSGGNPDGLRPEHAETLNVSAEISPVTLPGLRLQFSYYKVRYRDRIRQPILSSLGLFSNPVYASFITLTPTATQIAAALAGASTGLSNQAGAPYDPARVVAIVDNRQQNTARQNIEGVDASLRYGLATSSGKLTLMADLTYLQSQQVVVAGQPTVDLAGTIYNAPSWRARSGFWWEVGGFSASGYINFIDGSEDRRLAAIARVPSLTTVDASLTYRTPDQSALRGLEIALSAMNLLNAEPGRIRQGFSIEPPYDSANYSPVGRFVSLSVRKQW